MNSTQLIADGWRIEKGELNESGTCTTWWRNPHRSYLIRTMQNAAMGMDWLSYFYEDEAEEWHNQARSRKPNDAAVIKCDCGATKVREYKPDALVKHYDWCSVAHIQTEKRKDGR